MQTQDNRILLVMVGTIEKVGPGRVEFLPDRIVNPLMPAEDWQAQGKVKAAAFEITVNDPRLLRDLEPGRDYTLGLATGSYFNAGEALRR